ncbi:NUMOD4 domain-containing protein [Clostridium sp.]|uniref:NUMOD4 domain-containing protein n=1 Tax=Clostridium sp. TaxID=1506 RepID=UPI0028447E9A|nr:NUMOD4 domain-containing protein [Clostridium sp.]MDR3596674.1 NUMOD4 domain-containing protein [Clostridium sp.]
MEIWKDIVGYKKSYQVSNLGNIRSKDRYITTKKGVIKPCKGVMIKQHLNKNGYKFLKLKVNGISKNFETHRLVAQAFIPNPNNHPCVNHMDENPLNNNLDNLEWCTFKYNSNYGTRNEKRIKHTNFENFRKGSVSKETLLKRAKSQSKTVYQYDKNLNLIKIWQSARECARNGFNQGHISACCRKDANFKSHKGYIWSYTELK